MEKREHPASSLEGVKRAIEALPREDRAMLRPWILARFDVRGYPVRGYVEDVAPGVQRSKPS